MSWLCRILGHRWVPVTDPDDKFDGWRPACLRCHRRSFT